MEDMCSIGVKFNKPIYKNPTNDYTVALFNVEDGNCIICVGKNGLPNVKNITYRFDGNWVNSQKYGKQFNVSGYAEEIKNNKNGIITYLCSPLIKGVGKVMAERIYQKFGQDTFRVLEDEPEKLKAIKGMSLKKYNSLIQSYQKNRAVTKIYETLKGYENVTVKLSMKIFSIFKAESMQVISQHPYKLCRIEDIGFATADKIAKSHNIPEDNYERFVAAIFAVLSANEIDGNLGMELQEFGIEVKKLLNSALATSGFINDNVKKAIHDGFITCHHDKAAEYDRYLVYKKNTDNIESNVAKELVRLLNEEKNDFGRNKIDNFINTCEKNENFKADKIQIEAIKMALKEPLSVIAGGPGTGKTTVMKIIIEAYRNFTRGQEVVLMAPTGRASRNMASKTGCSASTIHSKLHIRDEKIVTSDEDDDTDIYDSLVIIDETSMVDIWVAYKLFSSIKAGCKVLIVGDPGQLQSVGAGAVLRDIIGSNIIPTTTLTTVFRQGKESLIYENAQKIVKGDISIRNGDDFVIEDGLSGESLEKRMINVYIASVEEYGLENVACLCPVKDYDAGVNSMNRKLQERLNPSGNKAELKVGVNTFRVGDPVMELANNSLTSNGDIGIIRSINKVHRGEEVITVNFFDEFDVDYKPADFDRIVLAYAMTVHKAQGSEYKSVITCLQDVNKKMANMNLINTAVTRATEIVYFLGSENALKRAILNNITNKRKTMLQTKLRFYSGHFINS